MCFSPCHRRRGSSAHQGQSRAVCLHPSVLPVCRFVCRSPRRPSSAAPRPLPLAHSAAAVPRTSPSAAMPKSKRERKSTMHSRRNAQPRATEDRRWWQAMTAAHPACSLRARGLCVLLFLRRLDASEEEGSRRQGCPRHKDSRGVRHLLSYLCVRCRLHEEWNDEGGARAVERQQVRKHTKHTHNTTREEAAGSEQRDVRCAPACELDASVVAPAAHSTRRIRNVSREPASPLIVCDPLAVSRLNA